MTNDSPTVSLEEVIQHRKEFFRINDLDNYKRVRVQLHAKGIVLRDTIAGSEIRTKTQQVCRAGEFLVAEIDAKVGGFGVVPDDLDGSIVSSHYFLFEINKARLDRRFLDYFVRTTSFRDQVTARGSTNYAAIRPHHVLQYQIPLPPLPEQRRIVARIEELAAKIEEARGLRRRGIEEAEMLLKSELALIFRTLIERIGSHQLSDLIINAGYGTSTKCNYERLRGSVPVLRIPNVASERVNFDGIKYGILNEAELNRVLVTEGDLLMVRTNGSPDLVGRCAVAQHLSEPTAFASYMIRLQCDRNLIVPDFLQLMLKHLRTDGKLIDFARTTAGQFNVSLSRLRAAKLPVPPIPKQLYAVEHLEDMQAKVDALKSVQVETSAELDAMLLSVLDKAFSGNL